MVFDALIITEVPQEERDGLWDQGVDLDDYDTLIMFEDLNILKEKEIEEQSYDSFSYSGKPKIKKIKIKTLDEGYLGDNIYYLERLLNGCYKNVWYIAEFRGKKMAIGVAYHA